MVELKKRKKKPGRQRGTTQRIIEGRENKMRLREKVFAAEYIKHFNATRAALTAGFSKRSAGLSGHKLLRRPRVQRLIAKKIEDRRKRLELEADDVLDRLWNMQRQATEDGEYSTAVRALELIGKHLGMFVERKKLGLDSETMTALAARKQGLLAKMKRLAGVDEGNETENKEEKNSS